MIRLILVGGFLVLFLVLGIPLLLFETYLSKKDRQASLRQSTAVVRWAFRVVLFFSGTDIRAEGTEHVPEGEAVLFVGNHRSYFDIISTYSLLKEPVGFVAKSEMKKIPLLRGWMERIGCLFLDRRDAKEGLKTILRAIEQVKEGTSVFIYPEGTRNRAQEPLELMEFHDGSLKIAQKAGCLVVPVAIYGSDDIFERHVPFIRPSEVHIRFGEPFRTKDIPAEYSKRQGLYLRRVIQDMLRDMTH